MPTTKRTWKTNTRRTQTTSAGRGTGTGWNPRQFAGYRQEVAAKIGSFRNINQQFTGAGKVTTFSPTGAARWINFVNQGARIYKFNNTQFARMFGAGWNPNTPPSVALRQLKKKFGTGIKAVAPGKGNNWLVAASPNVSAKPFSTYNWK